MLSGKNSRGELPWLLRAGIRGFEDGLCIVLFLWLIAFVLAVLFSLLPIYH